MRDFCLCPRDPFVFFGQNEMSAFSIKMIALISMVMDHCGEYLFPGEKWMRLVGRLAFPLYCFLLTEGFRHTRDVKKYLFRLGLFALISEIPYDLLGHDTFFYPGAQSVFFTLTLGLYMLYLMDWTNSVFLKGLILISSMAIAQYCHFNYRYPGIFMIFAFDYFRDLPLLRDLNVIAANIRLYNASVQVGGSLALIPISFYNGKRGPSLKYFFYIFYPAHLMVLYFLKKGFFI